MIAPVDGPSATLVAIAKNEGAYLLEWLAYHLAIGFSRIIVYDNESADDTGRTLMRLSRRCEYVEAVSWPSRGLHRSPQTTAYNHAMSALWTDWVMFLDLDEFLVPFADGSLPGFLKRVPAAASSVHINWRGFGSSGLVSADYGFVTTAFTRCAHPAWGNNHHFKSMARRTAVEHVSIHNIRTKDGLRLLSDLQEFETHADGQSSRIVHDGIQINHYQSKTYEEFKQRMRRGDANYHPAHVLRSRDDSLVRFGHLDVNDCEDTSIAIFRERHLSVYRRLLDLL